MCLVLIRISVIAGFVGLWLDGVGEWVEREFMCLDIRCVSGFCKLLFWSSNL
ncbi:hypothetical protein KC19_12G070100 [Ceratodon purpureus]|uniref:Uncharacterized protein n=1 Tax=Ceratodon purpureus TaxID=3225 RepID=A0A8T0G5J4_CERPU|nr:hypothetical protein KC19_12G070100 [Ceratodon purpureus]